MTEGQKERIIESGKTYFREIIIPNHVKGLQTLELKKFKFNPFLVSVNISGLTSLLPMRGASRRCNRRCCLASMMSSLCA